MGDNFFVRTFYYNKGGISQDLAETFEEAVAGARWEFEHNTFRDIDRIEIIEIQTLRVVKVLRHVDDIS